MARAPRITGYTAGAAWGAAGVSGVVRRAVDARLGSGHEAQLQHVGLAEDDAGALLDIGSAERKTAAKGSS